MYRPVGYAKRQRTCLENMCTLGCELDDQGSVPGRGNGGIFFFAISSVPVLEPTQPPAVTPGVTLPCSMIIPVLLIIFLSSIFVSAVSEHEDQ
jgi:hypothetical protein